MQASGRVCMYVSIYSMLTTTVTYSVGGGGESSDQFLQKAVCVHMLSYVVDLFSAIIVIYL